MSSPELAAKQDALFSRLARAESLVVALSGGADSAYLAWASYKVLGTKSLAVTAISESFSAHDREQLGIFLQATQIAHEFIATRELDVPRYAANGADRCYFCKDELFRALNELAASRKFSAVVYGINADDTHDFRPGHRAAGEHGVLAPLLDCGLTKAEIRELSRDADLPTWDRPASACLSSRIPFGTRVTPEVLRQVERAEAEVRGLGFRQLRVRHFGAAARVEIAREELPRALQPHVAAEIVARVGRVGYAEVIIDPEGYRQGSLNAALKQGSVTQGNVILPGPAAASTAELAPPSLRILQ